MRSGVLIGAILLGILGYFFTVTVIGALVGIPILLVSFILFIYALAAKEPHSTVIIRGKGEEEDNDDTNARFHRRRERKRQVTPRIRPSATLYCRYCGALGPADSKYCPSCGKRQV